MIPVSLVIKGLYSYQGTQKIEFDKLIEGQLFGIFGSVGSGKSSILEAISFALYGETERLNQRDSRNYNMMNLKSDELLIDFQFKNYDDTVYRFTVRGKRNSKDFLKVNTFDRAAYKLIAGNWEPLESTSVESILGLSYKNFRRTIIIPQGKFQEFLQLGDSDRTKMLKEIFHLDKYEFYYQTLNLEKLNNDLLQNLSGQLSHYTLVNQELVSLKELEVHNLFDRNNEYKIQILEKETLFQKQSDLKKLYDERKILQESLGSLMSQAESIKTLEKKVSDYEYCQINFKDLLRRKLEVEQGINDKKAALAIHNELNDKNNDELELLEKEGIHIKADFQKQDECKELIADYQLVLLLKGITADREKLEKRIIDGQTHVDQSINDRSVAQQQLDLLKNKRIELKADLPDLNELVKLRSWFDKKEHFEQTIRIHESQLKELSSQIKEVVKTIQQQLKNPLLDDINEGIFPDYHSEEVKKIREQLQLSQGAIQKQVDHYKLQMKLGEFSTQLHNGEACMLCGSIHHPQILKVEDVKSHLLEAENQLMTIKDKDKFLENILHELSKLIYREETLRQQIGNTQTDLNKIVEANSEHEKSFVWIEFSPGNPAQVNESFHIAEKIQQELVRVEDEMQVLETIVVKKTNDCDRFEKAVYDLKIQLTGKESEYATLKTQIHVLSSIDYDSYSTAIIQEKIRELKEGFELCKKRFEEWSQRNTILSDQKIALQERIEFTKRSILENENHWKQLDLELKSRFIDSPYVSFEEIIDILERTFNDETERNGTKKIIATYYQQLYSLETQLVKLDSIIDNKPFDDELFTKLEEELLQLKRNYEETNANYIREQSILKKLKEDFHKKISLEKEYEKLQHRAANLYTLKQLFKSDGFVSYISTVYLQNLCEVANRRFYKLTRQQLRLEVTDKNEFQVRDFLNNGKVRNVKTLSGGQTFQASLSLALALAESVQQQNQANQNFFFLDEGFGSLDKDSLQTAFETLKALRKENRIVGIISHVEELQQEIDVFLTIVNDPFTGSKIMGNWE